jgi:hypothetical protein
MEVALIKMLYSRRQFEPYGNRYRRQMVTMSKRSWSMMRQFETRIWGVVGATAAAVGSSLTDRYTMPSPLGIAA